MSVVRASIDIPATPERVWELVMDPDRLGDWVTIHRRLVRADAGPPRKGFQMEQLLRLRGVTIDVHWKLTECRPHELAVWRGRGPARSRARTEYKIASEGDGTHFDYRNEFHPPLGFLGALASRALVGGMPEREAKLTLARLRALLEQPTAPPRSNGAE
jgi:Polyketide cyclase / dehydrase and lipid transport